MAIISASGATPVKLVPLPAAMPATCVPWSQSVIEQGSAVSVPLLSKLPSGFGQNVVAVNPGPEPVVPKQASSITRSPKKVWFFSTPVSNIATACPKHSYQFFTGGDNK